MTNSFQAEKNTGPQLLLNTLSILLSIKVAKIWHKLFSRKTFTRWRQVMRTQADLALKRVLRHSYGKNVKIATECANGHIQ